MLYANEACDMALAARTGNVWEKFCEYLPRLAGRRSSLELKGTVCSHV